MNGFFFTCVALTLGALLAAGCAAVRSSVEKEPDRMKIETDTFRQVPPPCLEQLKASVAKHYGEEYLYKNTIPSREPHYSEAVFAPVGNNLSDSVVIVKFDTLCAVKRAYRTKMIISEQYR